MKLRPYSLVTLSLHEGGQPNVRVSFHSDVRASALVIEAEERPFLSLECDEVQISVSTRGGGAVTDEDVTIARAIFNAAARYLADCERLNTSPLVVEVAG
ncbi:hypothetical protein AB0K48_05465 [Nonomuraea sp. NPDC055795]